MRAGTDLFCIHLPKASCGMGHCMEAAGGPTFSVGRSDCWQAGASCWEEASVLHCMDVSIGLLERPHDTEAGFSHREGSEEKQGRDTMASVMWSQRFSSAIFIIPMKPCYPEAEGTAQHHYQEAGIIGGHFGCCPSLPFRPSPKLREGTSWFFFYPQARRVFGL